MSNYMIFNGVDSREFDVHIFDLNTDTAPVHQIDEVVVPGRNGTLLLQNHRLENVEHRYMGVIYENAEMNLQWFRDAIMKDGGYQRLEDSIHPEEFYTARYLGGLEPTLARGRDMVKFVIEFNRKPQRFLKSGEEQITLSSSGQHIYNPTSFEANPIIRTVGSGTVTLNGVTVTIASNSKTYIDIDSDIMDCYCGADNCNSLVTFSGNKFPTIGSGDTAIGYTGVTSVKVTPRWWTV